MQKEEQSEPQNTRPALEILGMTNKPVFTELPLVKYLNGIAGVNNEGHCDSFHVSIQIEDHDIVDKPFYTTLIMSLYLYSTTARNMLANALKH